MDEKYELDYKAMFDQLFEMLNARLDIENEYFNTAKLASERSETVKLVLDNLTNLPMSEQLLILREYKKLTDVCLLVQTKHNFITEEEQ